MAPASDMATLKVSDAMHRGVVTCSASADLDEVAQAMAEHGIHCVVAIDEGPPAKTTTGSGGSSRISTSCAVCGRRRS